MSFGNFSGIPSENFVGIVLKIHFFYLGKLLAEVQLEKSLNRVPQGFSGKYSEGNTMSLEKKNPIKFGVVCCTNFKKMYEGILLELL